MADWNFDMSKAPRGKYDIVALSNGKGTRKVFRPVEIIVAGACGTVTVARWVDDERRFDMFTAEVPPIAWMPITGLRIELVDGKERRILPKHPTMSESWFSAFLRQRKGTGTPAERQRECLDWIEARAA